MMKHQLFHNFLIKFKDLLFLLFSFISVYFLSFFGLKYEYYGLKWHLLVTPFGLIYAKFSSNVEFNNWLIYLFFQAPMQSNSIYEICFSIIILIISFIYLRRFEL